MSKLKPHLMFATGLLMIAVFGYRLGHALVTPPLGWQELYLFGGLVIAYFLFRGANAEHRAAKQREREASK